MTNKQLECRLILLSSRIARFLTSWHHQTTIEDDVCGTSQICRFDALVLSVDGRKNICSLEETSSTTLTLNSISD